VAKLIALVEELRRDLPMVRDRTDREADAMQEAVDPQAMLTALERDLENSPPKDSKDTPILSLGLSGKAHHLK
jgi:uncharacterized membrane protein